MEEKRKEHTYQNPADTVQDTSSQAEEKRGESKSVMPDLE